MVASTCGNPRGAGRAALVALALAALAAPSLRAEEVRRDHATVELVAEDQSVQPGQPFTVGVRFVLEEHWHIYWRNPGDSGLPTTVSWTLPAGLTAGDISWPFPQRITANDLVTYGHEGEVLLLTDFRPDAKLGGESVTLRASVEWLVCKEECVPGDAELTLTLPVRAALPQPDAKWRDAFRAARARLPARDTPWTFKAGAGEKAIIIEGQPPEGFKQDLRRAAFFPYERERFSYGGEQVFTRAAGGAWRLTVPLDANFKGQVEAVRGVLVADPGWNGPDSARAVEVDTSLTLLAAKEETDSLWMVLLTAFLGGILLNVMPCVLPVVAPKVIGFVKAAGEGHGAAFLHGAVFSAGVLVSFWALAGTLLIVQSAGESLGWGFQFQSPAFVAAMAALMFLIGLSLFGVFEVGGSLVGVGGQRAPSRGLTASFLNGALATVVATPCTGPFLSAALGFALAQPPVAAMLVFTALGAGMASPYLLLAAWPALLRRVPRPGAWMVTLKQAMGFLMMATVVWLLNVYVTQTDAASGTYLLGGLVVVGAGAWTLGKWGAADRSARSRWLARGFAVLLVAAGVAAPVWMGAPDLIPWEPFSPKRLAELRAAGQPVFIDFTAEWCLTCKLNEAVALRGATVAREFERRGVVALKADWTKWDRVVTAALKGYGRSSVPLYVFYPRGEGAQPVFLPNPLTPGAVLDNIK
ncbi:MAG: thioredoxin family protein [Planctomycetes bacterium]|nr:thioredoxin family protein [Planctomycetota bacterium]